MNRLILCLLAAATAGSLLGQELMTGQRDFLSPYEVDLIREAQDPNDRVAQYLQIAALRLELVNQKLATEEDGRSLDIHRNLSDFGRIIETIDLVIDDALADGVDVADGLDAAVSEESDFLAKLRKIQTDEPEDLHRYEFVLEDAIEITADSLELAMEDSGIRKADVVAADKAEKKRQRDTMTPELAKDVDRIKGKTSRKEADYNRNRPTLLKPGEKPPN